MPQGWDVETPPVFTACSSALRVPSLPAPTAVSQLLKRNLLTHVHYVHMHTRARTPTRISTDSVSLENPDGYKSQRGPQLRTNQVQCYHRSWWVASVVDFDYDVKINVFSYLKSFY